MPNTLAHFGAQALGTRIGVPRFDVRWLLLGPVIPDLPWIGQRILGLPFLHLDLYDIRTYAIVQASLLFSLLLCGVFSLLSARPGLVFAVLGVNSAAHLLLDTVEIKWANGVHFFAPLSWQPFSFQLVWPESPIILGLTAIGLAGTIWLCFRARGTPIGLNVSRGRLAGALFLLGMYLTGPVFFMQAVLRSNTHFTATLNTGVLRTGLPVEFDRNQVSASASGTVVRAFSREDIRIANPGQLETGTYSLKGRFLDDGSVLVEQAHRHLKPLREIPTYLGLLLLVLAWVPFDRRRGPEGPR
jgi:hypothetical protein